MKQEKGITLIALIITIIVMLILVAVTLTIALGDDGIIFKAREARTKTESSQTAESELASETGAKKIDNIVEGGTENFLDTGTQDETSGSKYYTYYEDGQLKIVLKITQDNRFLFYMWVDENGGLFEYSEPESLGTMELSLETLYGTPIPRGSIVNAWDGGFAGVAYYNDSYYACISILIELSLEENFDESIIDDAIYYSEIVISS